MLPFCGFPSLSNFSASTFGVKNYNEEGQKYKIASKNIYAQSITVSYCDSNKKYLWWIKLVRGLILFLTQLKDKMNRLCPLEFLLAQSKIQQTKM